VARLFDNATEDNLNIGSAILTAVPFSIACWFNVNEVDISQTLLSIADTAGNSNHHHLRIDAGNTIFASSNDVGVSGEAASTTGITINTWHHACGVFSATNARAAFIDGGSKGTEATDVNPVGLDNTAIGVQKRVGIIWETSGHIAEMAIWNAALADAEVAALAEGYSPLLVRPQNLVFYAPLVRELVELIGGVTLVNDGTVVSNHPRVLYPATATLGGVPAAAAAALASQRLKIGVGR
jgi:hypothetical protein